ncbi:MAG: GNVR domain-containing protein [Acidobacteriaceae bacterium]
MKPSSQTAESLESLAPVWDESPAPPIDLLPLMRSILSRWPLLVGATLLGLVLAYGTSFLITPRFESKAVFLPPTQHNTMLDSPLAALWVPSKSALYPGLLASDSVVDDVIRGLDLQKEFHSKDMEDARRKLRSDTSVSSDASDFYTVRVLNKDPNRAKQIVAAYLDALARIDTRLAVDQATQQRAIYGQQLQREKNELGDAENALKTAQEARGVVSPQLQTQAGLSAIDQLRAQIGADQVALSALLQARTESSPDVVRLRAQIAALTTQMARMSSGSGGSAGAGITASRAPGINLEFARLQREVQFHQAMFEIMTRQFESARVQQTSSAQGIQIVDYPEAPLHKATPQRRIYALVGALLGFLAAFAIIFIRDRYRALRSDPASAGVFQVLHESVTKPTWNP